jgi:hypothetical protein
MKHLITGIRTAHFRWIYEHTHAKMAVDRGLALFFTVANGPQNDDFNADN